MDMFNESIGEDSYAESVVDENKKATIINDMLSYRRYATQFNLKHKPDVTSAILFWQSFAGQFPVLGKLAKRMLSTPASSVPSESCFSMSAFLSKKERSRLSGDNLSSSVLR
ncbi:unnamed protein product [Didymodactylos carnosus]|uniref:HAT C-terminal dimerisation domain-containing protein n=1 Tax=Didymodactylos carnosus TaxID=1234261 RepID=A0A815C8J9_9BILA|nr:unnamed protein product [Didymodactylos carnosus]CAF1280299.1 unnamed protein product [Didymodactylos carnosus]CAF3870578.1 unnamed protein product [Didymodactylos carnosus]CAF4075154.1 unnamed protein product [Didymodactylos carnosus]